MSKKMENNLLSIYQARTKSARASRGKSARVYADNRGHYRVYVGAYKMPVGVKVNKQGFIAFGKDGKSARAFYNAMVGKK